MIMPTYQMYKLTGSPVIKKGTQVIILRNSKPESNLWTDRMAQLTLNKVGKFTGETRVYVGHTIYEIEIIHDNDQAWYYFYHLSDLAIISKTSTYINY